MRERVKLRAQQVPSPQAGGSEDRSSFSWGRTMWKTWFSCRWICYSSAFLVGLGWWKYSCCRSQRWVPWRAYCEGLGRRKEGHEVVCEGAIYLTASTKPFFVLQDKLECEESEAERLWTGDFVCRQDALRHQCSNLRDQILFLHKGAHSVSQFWKPTAVELLFSDCQCSKDLFHFQEE